MKRVTWVSGNSQFFQWLQQRYGHQLHAHRSPRVNLFLVNWIRERSRRVRLRALLDCPPERLDDIGITTADVREALALAPGLCAGEFLEGRAAERAKLGRMTLVEQLKARR